MMITVQELQTKFEGLVPSGTTSITFDEFGSGSRDNAQDLCKEWSLKGTEASRLMYIYDHHPSVLTRSFVQQLPQGERFQSFIFCISSIAFTDTFL
jgi:hypothetical protein